MRVRVTFSDTRSIIRRKEKTNFTYNLTFSFAERHRLGLTLTLYQPTIHYHSKVKGYISNVVKLSSLSQHLKQNEQRYWTHQLLLQFTQDGRMYILRMTVVHLVCSYNVPPPIVSKQPGQLMPRSSLHSFIRHSRQNSLSQPSPFPFGSHPMTQRAFSLFWSMQFP